MTKTENLIKKVEENIQNLKIELENESSEDKVIFLMNQISKLGRYKNKLTNEYFHILPN